MQAEETLLLELSAVVYLAVGSWCNADLCVDRGVVVAVYTCVTAY